MAHTLTFSGVTVTIDGVAITSPYTLANSCTIVAELTADHPTPTTPPPELVVNGEQYALDTTIDISNSDITITGYKGDTGVVVTINYTEVSTPRLSVDVSTLAGWANLSAGEKNITIVAKAAGYKDSAPSAAVKVTKAAGETWVLKESSKWGTHNFTANFTSNNEKFTNIQTHFPALGDEYFIGYFAINEFTPVLTGAGEWTNQAYRTLTFETAPTGDLLTWLQANGKRAYSVTITKATLLNGTATIRDGNSGSATVIATLSADTDAGITVYPTSGNLYLDYSNSHGEPGYSWYSANWENPTGDINIDKNYLATVSGDGTIEISAGYYTCLTGDTLISLADGSQKRIDEIQLTDKVLAYNPETLTLESDEIIECDSNKCKWHTEYDIWTFSDGTVVQTVLRHRFYNVERQAMVYMDEWNIGEHTIRQDGSKVALISHKNIKEKVRHYTIFTKHQNYFANGLLSGNRYTKPMHLC